MRDLNLAISEVTDEHSRENFTKVEEEFRRNPLLSFDGKMFSFEFTKNLTNERIEHRLGFKPKDIAVTSQRGAGSVVFNFALFDRTHISVTTTGTSPTNPLMIRALIGSYVE